jgi:hypothetical protein
VLEETIGSGDGASVSLGSPLGKQEWAVLLGTLRRIIVLYAQGQLIFLGLLVDSQNIQN